MIHWLSVHPLHTCPALVQLFLLILAVTTSACSLISDVPFLFPLYVTFIIFHSVYRLVGLRFLCKCLEGASLCTISHPRQYALVVHESFPRQFQVAYCSLPGVPDERSLGHNNFAPYFFFLSRGHRISFFFLVVGTRPESLSKVGIIHSFKHIITYPEGGLSCIYIQHPFCFIDVYS